MSRKYLNVTDIYTSCHTHTNHDIIISHYIPQIYVHHAKHVDLPHVVHV